MRSKEEQERIVKRALSMSLHPAEKSPEIGPPACSNCGAFMTPTVDVSGKPLWECRACDVGDGTDRPDGVVGDGASVVAQIVEGGEIVAVLICSKILESHVWLAFDNDFKPADGQVVFYAHELEFLKTKTPEQLREIHKVKVAFGPGSRVRK
jgi:hypothetical protein